jgi:SHAQKYF class myb-like DNA-binding protein
MRPIRGIPVYSTTQPLPFLQSHPHHHHHHPHCYDAIGVGHAGGPRSPKAALRLAGASAKRGARAPRMRWTTSLHARFVHAVELLGGHESTRPASIALAYVAGLGE